jgi:glutathione S-transferase
MMIKDLDVSPYPQLVAYMQRLKERPGYSMG